jgi:hypothetical protein
MWKKLKSVFRPDQSPALTTLFSPVDPEPLTDYQKAFYSPPVSYSEKFPEIPKPIALTVPEILAVRWASGEILPEQAPGIAADLLESGLDTPSMRRLAGEMHVKCLADVQSLVIKMLGELGVKVPNSEGEAKLLSTRQIAREVIAGMRNPWKSASELERIWSYEIWHHKDLCDVAQILEELDCGSIARGALPQLTEELVEVFARIGAYAEGEKRQIRFGLLEGKGWIAEDFNAPLPDDLLALFEGRDEPDAK